jgi:hypothetical protein
MAPTGFRGSWKRTDVVTEEKIGGDRQNDDSQRFRSAMRNESDNRQPGEDGKRVRKGRP